MDYANWSDNMSGNQPFVDFNTQSLAEQYRCARRILRKVKCNLFNDVNRTKRSIELASEESDAQLSRAPSLDVGRRTSSVESIVFKPNYALQLKQLAVKTMEANITENLSVESSSADEADDERNIQASAYV